MSANIDEARKVARTLLDDLETVTVRTEGVLMKAGRLARLMRDADAQTWLDLETRGYPKNFRPSSLGTCEQYALSSGRFSNEGKYLPASLPTIEAEAEGLEASVRSFQKMDSIPIVENHVAKKATAELLAHERKSQDSYRKEYSDRKALVVSLKSAIHRYATDTFLAIEFGDVAQDIFETAREGAIAECW
jgi:hypothetical protein